MELDDEGWTLQLRRGHRKQTQQRRRRGGGKSNLREEWDGTGGEGTPEGAEEEEEERIPGLDRKEGSSSKKRMNDLWSFWTKDRSFENTVEVQICERSDP